MNLRRTALVLTVCLLAGATQAAGKNAKPEFRLTAGKGYTVCEAYLKHLQSIPTEQALPRCELWFDPKRSDFTRPQWEELDVLQNIDLVREIEPMLRDPGPVRVLGIPSPATDGWRPRFEALMREGTLAPRLRRTRLTLISGEPETLIAYKRHAHSCPSTAEWMVPDIGASHFILRQSGAKTLRAFFGHVGTHLPGEVVLFRERPYVFWVSPSAVPDYQGYRWQLEINFISQLPSETDEPRYVAAPRCIFKSK